MDLYRSSAVLKIILTVAAALALGLLVWQLSHVLVLAFAAVLFAIILRSLAEIFERYTPVRSPWSLILGVLLFAALIATFFFTLGLQVKAQISTLIEQLPQHIASVSDRLGIDNLQEHLAERAQNVSGSGLLATAAGYTSVLLNAATDMILIIITGIYLAGHQKRYFNGVLKLVPEQFIETTRATLANIGRALQFWLIGQAISMLIVGIAITAGLYVIGLPSALALGFIAGMSEFVPVLGPVMAAVPAVVLAISEGGSMVYWVLALYILVQQLESYAIMPLVQRKAVHLPPVLTILAIVGFGSLFGIAGLLLGAPLTVVLLVSVEQLYVRHALGKSTNVPGENGGP